MSLRTLAGVAVGLLAAGGAAAALANFRNLDRRQEALTAADEAVDIYRRLYSRWPDAFRGQLAAAEEALRGLRMAAGRTSDEPAPPLVLTPQDAGA